jgi:hypothetical protein
LYIVIFANQKQSFSLNQELSGLIVLFLTTTKLKKW